MSKRKPTDQQIAEAAIVRIQMDGTNLTADYEKLRAIEDRLETALEVIGDAIAEGE